MVNQEKNKYQSHILVEQIDQFVDYLGVEKHYASNTISAYQRDLLKFLSFCLENSVTEWQDIEPETLNHFVMELRHRGVSARSIRRYLSSIRGFFTFLVKQDVLTENCVISIQTPKIDQVLPKIIDFDDIKRMTTLSSELYSELRTVAMIELMYSCGLRVSELVAIDINDLDLEEGFVRVKGKGGKTRFSPIGRSAINAVEMYLSKRPSSENEALFVNQNNNRVSPRSVQNIINKQSEEIQKSLSDLSTYVQETFSGIRLIKSFVREMNFSKVFDKKSEDYKSISLKLQFVMALFFPIVMTLIGLSIIITVYVGALEFFKGNITIGNIAEFLIYVYLLTWPVTALGWLTSIIQRASASQKRINEFLNQKTNIISKSNKILNLKGKIEFKDVSFIYPDTGIKALNNLNFKVKAGESLGIIGSTGSGKSTIANSIMRLFDINKGKILIDDENIKDLHLIDFRKQIGYVPQDIFLFSDTITNNILFGCQNEDFNLVLEAAKNTDLMRNINSFPKKFETKIGERGITLSGGQKQRISIARAIIKKPKILILDDCLSALDTKTENIILENFKKIMKKTTTIIISHRISSVKLANQIIVIEDGEIIESGSHKTLLNNKKRYFKTYNRQIEKNKQKLNIN